MDTDSTTDTVDKEQLPVEEIRDLCALEYYDIIPLTRDSDDSCTTGRVTGDQPAEVIQDTYTVVQQEAEDVHCVICVIFYFSQLNGIVTLIICSRLQFRSCFNYFVVTRDSPNMPLPYCLQNITAVLSCFKLLVLVKS